MDIMDNLKDVASNAGEKIADVTSDIKDKAADLADKAGDKIDELKADAAVKKAELEKKATEIKNDIKEDLRNDKQSALIRADRRGSDTVYLQAEALLQFSS